MKIGDNTCPILCPGVMNGVIESSNTLQSAEHCEDKEDTITAVHHLVSVGWSHSHSVALAPSCLYQACRVGEGLIGDIQC